MQRMSFAVLLISLVGFAMASASAQTISGRATVVSGDTIEIRGERLRLLGVDAAEDDLVCESTDDHRYRCGLRAARALDEFLDESIVSCTPRERDQAGQMQAFCTANGIDLGLWLVRNGLARDLPDTGRYRLAQEQAKAAQKGIWSTKRR